jgi:hypothetical protein
MAAAIHRQSSFRIPSHGGAEPGREKPNKSPPVTARLQDGKRFSFAESFVQSARIGGFLGRFAWAHFPDK